MKTVFVGVEDIDAIVGIASKHGVGKDKMRGLNVKDGRVALDIEVESVKVERSLTKSLKSEGYIVTSIKDLGIIEVRKNA